MSEEVKPQRSGAITKIMESLKPGEPLTHAALMEKNPELKHEQIGMSLSYLNKRGLIDRELVARSKAYGRKEVYAYRLKAKSA
jgi:hypothetical protein